MEWISGLQNAIDYIEAHLTEELGYQEVARQAYSSNFHFQRVFGILCGCTLGEYIRSRRLTLAGSELASTKCRVIDVALKYGYDSPESFSRAFTKFHGIRPSEARSNKARLRSFSRLSVKLILEGGTVMDYRIEEKDAFQVIAKKKRYTGGTEIGQQQIHRTWEECGKDGTIEALCSYIRPDGVFGEAVAGVCFDSPDKGDFDYAIAAAYDGSEVKEGFTIEEIPANTWMVFSCTGPLPGAFQDLMKKVYTEVFPTNRYQPSGGMCIELYPGDNVKSEDYTCELWFSVAAK